MRRVLLVSFSFAPSPHAGARRAVGLYKYLAAYGWEVTIVTATQGQDPESNRIVRSGYMHRVGPLKKMAGLSPDRTTEEQLRQRGMSERTIRGLTLLVRGLGELLAYPDFESGWFGPAVETGRRALRNQRFDAIVSTSPPATAHLVSRRLSELSGLPWVADLRDLWTQNYTYPWSRLRRHVERRLERATLRSAAALVTVSTSLVSSLARIHPHHRIVSILNGFDPADLATRSERLTDAFTLTYTGTLYPGKQDPIPLLEALQNAIDTGQMRALDLRLRIYCRSETERYLSSLCTRYRLSSRVEFGGVRPHDEILQLQRESQLLVFFDWNDPRQPGVYTAKLFEYLAARRPILASGFSGGVVEDVLRATGAGSYERTRVALEQRLLDYYGEFRSRGAVQMQGDVRNLRTFSHERMAKEFAELLNSIVG